MPRDLQDDRNLAERARRGDSAAWRALYEGTCDRLFAFLCWQVGDRDEARDILQETYLQAFRRLATWRGEAPLDAWLRAIAFRRATDWKRVALRRIRRMTSLDESRAPSEDAPRDAHFVSESDSLRRALIGLSPHQRAALLLREWDDCSFQEIASLLGCAESTARVHHTRARERMRAMLGDGRHPANGPAWGGQQT
jgi:RNA polymerase sigma-70 factor (ECF subfamily)